MNKRQHTSRPPVAAMPHRKQPQHPPRKPPAIRGKLPKPHIKEQEDRRRAPRPPRPPRSHKK